MTHVIGVILTHSLTCKGLTFISHRMRNTVLLSLLTCLGSLSSAFSQSCSDPVACNYNPEAGPYCVQTEIHYVHTEGDLAGMTTYRLYVLTDTPEDKVSAVFGDSLSPLTISTTTEFFQDPLGAVTPNAINPLLYPAFPSLPYDSWITVWIEQVPSTPDGEGEVLTVQDAEQPWMTNFEAGDNIEISTSIGGSWFVTSDLSNGTAGADLKILIGQFTTDGDLSGTVNVAIFPEGEQVQGSEGDVVSLPIGVMCECTYPDTLYVDNDGDGFGTTPVVLCGGLQEGYALQGGDCNDNTALAYPGNPFEAVGDGIDGNCDGNELCYRDTDNDGYRSLDTTDTMFSPNINCSEFGEAYVYQPFDCNDTDTSLTLADEDGNCLENVVLAGDLCSDPGACNYNPEASAEEDNCEYLSCRGCPNPTACNYDPDALILTEAICEYTSCAGCSNPEATNYNPNAVISDDGLCFFTGVLAIGPVGINYNEEGGPNGTYTNEVYALLPPAAIRLKRVLGVKGGNVRLRVAPFDQMYQSASCGDWMPHDMASSVEVDGVVFTNPDCYADSWFTIGGTVESGPVLEPFGFDPSSFEQNPTFDSDDLALEGDSLGWQLAGDTGGEPGNFCEQLLNRPGCANAVRIARVTMPIGQSFLFQAGLTYSALGTGERSLTGQDFTDDSSISSSGGGGGEADSDDPVITDGNTATTFGCLNELACNYNASANEDSGNCDFTSCAGCTYVDADNYSDTATLDDGTCTFTLGTGEECFGDFNGDGGVGSADLLEFLSVFNNTCE